MSGASSSGKGGSSSRQGEQSKQARRQVRAKQERRSAEASEAASKASRAGERSASERSASKQRGERVWYYASEASKVRACMYVVCERLCVKTAPNGGLTRSRLTTDLVRVLYMD